MARLVLLVGVCFIGAFVGVALAAVVLSVVWDVPLTSLNLLLSGDAFHPHQRAIVRTTLTLQQIATFTLAPLVLLAFTVPARPLGQWVRAQGRVSGGWLLAGVLLTVASLPLLSGFIEWNAGWHFSGPLAGFDQWMRDQEATARRLTLQVARMDSGAELLATLVALALVPAVGEELVFRGIVQPTLTRGLGGRAHLGIWLTAAVFSAIHLQFLGFVPRLLLGAGFGYLYQWSGRLAVPIAAHFTNNAVQVLLLYLSQRGTLSGFDPDSTSALPLPWVLASGAATAGLLLRLRRAAAPALPAAPDDVASSADA